MRCLVCLTIVLLLTTGCRPAFDEAGYSNLVEYHKTWNHADVSNPAEFLTKIRAEINKHARESRVVVPYDADFSLSLRKDAEANRWRAEGFLRIKMPEKGDYKDTADFMAACVDYHASAWILKHPDKPFFYCPACPPMKREDGAWAAETGPAVISGGGLLVVVDEGGNCSKSKRYSIPIKACPSRYGPQGWQSGAGGQTPGSDGSRPYSCITQGSVIEYIVDTP